MSLGNTVYIAGPISGVENYWIPFLEAGGKAEVELGYRVLSPIVIPEGYSKAEYMRLCFAMIDMADVVYFLPGSEKSGGADLERRYCDYTDKPYPHDIEELRRPNT
jgi:hypothetical protein